MTPSLDVSARRLAITVNGDPHEVAAGESVAGLIEALGLGGKRLAVAINREVVRRVHYAERRLEAGDHVEILEAVGGG